jgi:hypothetical protein
MVELELSLDDVVPVTLELELDEVLADTAVL